MRIGIIGDIHGRKSWEKIITDSSVDKWVFIGDYFDSRGPNITGQQQLENFRDIIAFKKAYPEKVILLTGNHDFHYINGVGETYSGYQAAYAISFGEEINAAIRDGLLQMCYLVDTYFISHAGITKTWASANLESYPLVNDTFVDEINDLFYYKPNVFKFTAGEYASSTGNDITQTPIWVRPEALLDDMVEGITCIVGHTNVSHIRFKENLVMIDCLGDINQYLIIDGSNLKVGSFKYD